MDITPELLTANGREEIGYSRYTKSYQRNWFFKVNLTDLDHPVVFLDGIELPPIRTMEHLSLLFALLGDPPDAELEARLRETLVQLAIPPGLRRLAGALDRAMDAEFGEVTR